MNDALVVVALLLFGSSLFCLCCYKVSNLLYMLYHINDSDSVTGDTSNEAVGISSMAAAQVAVSTPTVPTTVSSSEKDGSDGKNNGGVSFYSHINHFSRRPIEDSSNYNYASPGFDAKGTSTSLITLVQSSSATSLASKQKNLRKTGSVLSLSIGVQCTPDDVDFPDSDEGINGPMRKTSLGHISIPQQKILSQRNLVHTSAPDFSYPPDTSSGDEYQHNNYDHHHHQVQKSNYNVKPSTSIMNVVRSRNGPPDYFLPSLPKQCHRHHYKEYASVTPMSVGREYLDHHTSSLGRFGNRNSSSGSTNQRRRNQFRPSPLSDSEPDIGSVQVWQAITPASMTTSTSKHKSSRGPTRRYGSIRVSECSFIEHPDSNSSPLICDARTSTIKVPRHMSSSGSSKGHSHHYVASQFDRVSDDDSPDETFHNVYIPKGNAPEIRLGHSKNGQGCNAVLSNGPKSAGLSTFRANPTNPARLNVIPPPQDFGGEFSNYKDKFKQKSNDDLICMKHNFKL